MNSRKMLLGMLCLLGAHALSASEVGACFGPLECTHLCSGDHVKVSSSGDCTTVTANVWCDTYAGDLHIGWSYDACSMTVCTGSSSSISEDCQSIA